MLEPKKQSVSDFIRDGRRTGLLVSVRDLAEARTCLACGVDILDLKEPDNGALGSVNVQTLAEVSSFVTDLPLDQQTTLSFAAGEIVDWDRRLGTRLIDRYGFELIKRFQFVKLGLARAKVLDDWQASLSQLFDGLPDSTQPVAVGYFDHVRCEAPSIDDVVAFAGDCAQVRTVLLDTFCKECDLFKWIDEKQLKTVIQACRRRDLSVVVAGSLTKNNLPRVKSLLPDFVGVRGAICQGDRREGVDAGLLNDFKLRLQNAAQGKELAGSDVAGSDVDGAKW